MNEIRAIVCDDNWALAGIIQHLLKKEGIHVTSAADGAEGLAYLRNQPPQLLVLDLNMPIKDGFAVLEDLKRQPVEGMWVIVMSNFENPADIERVRGMGAHAILAKPFFPTEFSRVVQTILSEGHA